MHAEGFFAQAFVYLLAAVVSVPIAKRLGLGSVLGYLIAGIAIGPFVLGLVGEEGQDVLHFAEFGVVMMLFVIGLELEPSLLWRMRGPILGLGGLQVGLTALVITGVAIAFGETWKAGLAIGLTLALSSTAIVLQTLAEKGLMKTDAGQSSFAVLLFQDIAVIPMLAIFPLLAMAPLAAHPDEGHGAGHGPSWVEGLPGWAQTLVVLAAVATIVLGGRFVVRPAFRFIAGARLREAFTAATLLLVIGIALLMSQVGLSPALGTFLAGVVLANSEFRHELEGDIEPFKGLLLGLFFISVGASIDFGLIAAEPGRIAAMVAGLMVLKLAILLGLGRFFGMSLDQNLLFSFALAQGGEFAFVLFSFATQNRVLDPTTTAPLIAAVATSMAATPVLLVIAERFLLPRVGTREADRQTDAIDDGATPVLIAGFGSFGSVAGRLLRANGVRATVLDFDSDRVDVLRRLGLGVFYGDATRLDLLEAAGAREARLLLVAVDDPGKALEIVDTAQRHFPHLKILVRATGRSHAYELLDREIDGIYRENLDSSLRMGIDALRELGFRAHQATRSAARFRCHDEESVRELHSMRHDDKMYMSRARERIRDLEAVIEGDLTGYSEERDAGWDTESLRRDYGGGGSDPE